MKDEKILNDRTKLAVKNIMKLSDMQNLEVKVTVS